MLRRVASVYENLVECVKYYKVHTTVKKQIQKTSNIKYICLLFLSTFLLYKAYKYYDYQSKFYIQLMHMYQDFNTPDSETCHIPDYDPYDPSIRKYIKKAPPIDCGDVQLSLTYVNTQGYLHVNLTAVHEAGFTFNQLLCAYKEVIRKNDDDDHIILGKTKMILRTRLKLTHEYIVVRCYDRYRNMTVIYETGHAQVKPLDTKLDIKSKVARKAGALNVVILALDSTSRLNFMRQLPRTYDFLQRQMNATVFKGLNKIGENTLPNIMALLSGHTFSWRGSKDTVIGPVFQINRSGYFDEMPAAWRNFSRRGYVTLLSEDAPGLTMFNYIPNGFKRPPTDYYTRPFWLAMERATRTESKDDRCYGHIPKHKFLWNYTENFINKMHQGENAHFVFNFDTYLGHDDLNNIQVADDDLAAMLKRLKTSGSLDHTVFILMGDHGNRINSIRKTVIGSVEDRMPFFSISLPDELQHFRENVEKNARVLTSWHDVYETLMDIATDNLQPESRVVRHGYHGSSLLREISSNRTCRDVGVPDEYCVCNVERKISADSAHAHTAAHAVVDYINLQLVQEDLMSLCAEHVFDHVIHALISVQPGDVTSDNQKEILIRVVFSTKPSNATFEGLLKISFENGTQIVGDVNRINRYGHQSGCIDKKLFRKYCYCKLI